MDGQTSISYSEVLMCSILPYVSFFLKEVCVCTGGDLQCTVWEILPGMRGKDCGTWTHIFTPLDTANTSSAFTSSLFSCAASHQWNDLAFGEKWKTCFLCKCTSAINYFICVQLNQITNKTILHWLIPSDLLFYTKHFLWWVNMSFPHTINVVKTIPSYPSSLCSSKEEN